MAKSRSCISAETLRLIRELALTSAPICGFFEHARHQNRSLVRSRRQIRLGFPRQSRHAACIHYFGKVSSKEELVLWLFTGSGQ